MRKLTIPRQRDRIIIPRGCVLYYDMQDMGSKIIDHSGFNRHGTNFGSTSIAVPGGRARLFDGVDDYVQVPAFPLKGSVLTIGAWVKCSLLAQCQTILGDASQSTTVGYLFTYRGTKTNTLGYVTASGSDYVVAEAANYFLNQDDKWLMVAIATDYANRVVRFFRNGRLFSTRNPAATMLFPSASRVRYVGSYSSTANRFSGPIGHVWLCEALLTDAEIAELFRATAPMYGVAA